MSCVTINRVLGVAVTAVVLTAGLTACTGGSSEADTESAATLTVANDRALTTFDPSQADAGSLLQYYQPVFDTLIRRTSEGEYVPMLATEWSYDDTNTSLTLDLRTDVTFSDGSAFDAEAAAFNLLRTRDGGGEQSVTLASVESVDVVDEDTIDINLSQPDPGLIDSLTRAAGLVASPTSLESPDVATVPVGSGPYELDAASTVPGDTYVYTAKSDYWDPSLQRFGSIVIKTLEDSTARINALKSGQINAGKADIGQIGEAEAAGLDVQTSALSWSGLVLYDREGASLPALGDVRVRQAIAHALDREGLLTALRDGRGTVTDQFFGSESPAYSEELDDVYDYDPELARELLAEAGYPDGFEVTVPDLSAVFGAALYSAVEQQLSDVGITVTREQGAIPDLITKINAQGFGIGFVNYMTDTGWPTVSNFVLPTGGYNPFHSTDDTVAELIDQIRTTGGDEQDAAYRALNEHLVEQTWIVPFFRDEQVYVNDDTITVDIGTGVPPSIYDFAPATS